MFIVLSIKKIVLHKCKTEKNIYFKNLVSITLLYFSFIQTKKQTKKYDSRNFPIPVFDGIRTHCRVQEKSVYTNCLPDCALYVNFVTLKWSGIMHRIKTDFICTFI